MARLTSKGQVTIPRAAREQLGIYPGSEVEFVVRDHELIIRKASIRAAIERWSGRIREQDQGKATDEIMEELRGPVLG